MQCQCCILAKGHQVARHDRTLRQSLAPQNAPIQRRRDEIGEQDKKKAEKPDQAIRRLGQPVRDWPVHALKRRLVENLRDIPGPIAVIPRQPSFRLRRPTRDNLLQRPQINPLILTRFIAPGAGL